MSTGFFLKKKKNFYLNHKKPPNFFTGQFYGFITIDQPLLLRASKICRKQVCGCSYRRLGNGAAISYSAHIYTYVEFKKSLNIFSSSQFQKVF